MSEPKYTHITRDGRFEARIIENINTLKDTFPIKVVLKPHNGSTFHTYYKENMKFHLDETRSDMDLFLIQEYKTKKTKRGLIGLGLSCIPLLYAIIFLIAWENGDYRKAFDLEYIAAFYTVIIAAAIVIISAITAFYYLILKPRVNRWK